MLFRVRALQMIVNGRFTDFQTRDDVVFFVFLLFVLFLVVRGIIVCLHKGLSALSRQTKGQELTSFNFLFLSDCLFFECLVASLSEGVSVSSMRCTISLILPIQDCATAVCSLMAVAESNFFICSKSSNLSTGQSSW